LVSSVKPDAETRLASKPWAYCLRQPEHQGIDVRLLARPASRAPRRRNVFGAFTVFTATAEQSFAIIPIGPA
jgi:hypothetical protein